MFWLKENRKTLSFVLLVILLSLPSVFSLLKPGFFNSDDGEWMIIRSSAFYQAFREGQFPVRFLERLNFGYGYPVANFLYPGFLYLSVFIHLLGLGFVATIKIIFAFSMVLSGVFCFLWLSKLFDRVSSLIGCLLYLYLPYHLHDLYTRGSIGEILALAVIPFVLWQIERKSLFWTTLSIGSLILAHNTLALIFLPVIIIYMLLDVFVLKKKRRNLLYKHGLALILGLGISSFFWIPAVFDLQYTVFSKTSVSEWSRYFAGINLIGPGTILVFILVGVMFALKKTQVSKHNLTPALLIIGLVSLFFAIPISSQLWNILPVYFIQFPFRFLSVTILCVAFLSARVFSVLPKRLTIPLAAVFLFLTVISAFPYILPKEFVIREEGFYTTNEATTTVKDEYLPFWVKEKPSAHYNSKVEIVSGKTEIKNLVHGSKKITFESNTISSAKIIINTVYYPGWTAFINGKEQQIEYDNPKGVMGLSLIPGRNKVEVVFKETPKRLTADIISLVAFFAVFYITFLKKYKTT